MTNGTATWNFTYDAEGMRTARTDGTTTYTYTYNSGQLSQMTVGGKNVSFSYDASGAPQTMTYDGVTYYYITNPMGDVTGIANESGTRLVYYYYTAYGTTYASKNGNAVDLSTTLLQINPLTYRGYVYDRETGLYYLQSRYYNHKVGRFINADALVSTGQGLLGNNMFAYCANNPVIYVDDSGYAETAIADETYTESIPVKELISAAGRIVSCVLIIILVSNNADEMIDAQQLVASKTAKRARAASALMNYASSAATPPPPNKGGKGTQVTSKTLLNKTGKNGYRIDVENPGNREGQIHLRKDGTKYIYNIADQSFRIGASNGALAPDAIQALLLIPEVIIAIAKGLAILGY